jgi:predicted enzyme related to lactoylglutathione lyase
MKVIEIAFSCYPVTDMVRARAFYEGVLGLAVTYEADDGPKGHWVEYDIGASTLAIGRYDGWKPSGDGCTVGLEVDDFDKALAELTAAEIPIEMGPLETPVCHMVIVNDPDGNGITIHKRKPSHS